MSDKSSAVRRVRALSTCAGSTPEPDEMKSSQSSLCVFALSLEPIVSREGREGAKDDHRLQGRKLFLHQQSGIINVQESGVVTSSFAAVRRRISPASRPFSRVFSGTMLAPSVCAPMAATTHSRQLGAQIATRSPAPIPCAIGHCRPLALRPKRLEAPRLTAFKQGRGIPPACSRSCSGVGNGGRQRMEHQATSKSPAAPIPPATHMEMTTYLTPRRLPSIKSMANQT